MDAKVLNAYKWYEENYLSDYKFLVPSVFMLSATKKGKVCLSKNGGNIPTKEEWENMKILIDDFYRYTTNEEIEEHNNKPPFRPRIDNEPPKKTDKSGYVYLIKADNGLYKIGCSKNVDNRILQLGVKLPYKLTLVKKVLVDDMRKVERQYHKLHETKRVRGEWFDLSLQDVEKFN